MDRHNQTHNDIKPQNFLVKFKNGSSDLTQIEIALTDFGMADSDSKGGTPIFASPECFEKKEKKSDIFSFGRVILFLLLTKNQFIKWLFVPIKDKTHIVSLESIGKTLVSHLRDFFAYYLGISNVESSRTFQSECLNWISRMISVENRMSLKLARKVFDQLRQKSVVKLNDSLITEFERIIDDELSSNSSYTDYLTELSDFRYGNIFQISDVSLKN